MNSRKRVKAALDAITGMSKCSLISIASVTFLSVILLLIFVSVFVYAHPCDALEDCDPFKPICGVSSHGDHQFFYSHCDMEREICMTGQDWKSDNFSHCNVYTK